MAETKNMANQFPFEWLASQINRNEFNYQSILNGLVEWNETNESYVVIRLVSEEAPYYQDYSIPSKKVIESGSTVNTSTTGEIVYLPLNLIDGDTVTIEVVVNNYGSVDWNLYAVPALTDNDAILIQELIEPSDSAPGVITFSYTATEALSGFRLIPNGTTTTANISLFARLKEIIPPTPYNRSVGVYNDVNYAKYPYDTTAVWSSDNIGTSFYSTDESVPITTRQAYSASMVFDHSLADTKTVNFINYEGPDLDQGLCIYLPVLANGSKPQDGYTLEFNFRIYPNPAYTRSLTSDHIINKAQIYVYSIPDTNSIDSGIDPIARFSMARMTNYYIWAENIAIPDKPVSYYAQFIYSELLQNWILLSFNQMDDHVFIGPVGFVDPLEYSMNELSEFQSYETSALPTYTDPFSDIQLQRYSNRNDPDATRRTI